MKTADSVNSTTVLECISVLRLTDMVFELYLFDRIGSEKFNVQNLRNSLS